MQSSHRRGCHRRNEASRVDRRWTQVDAARLVTLNKRRYPGICQTSRLRAGTKLVLPQGDGDEEDKGPRGWTEGKHIVSAPARRNRKNAGRAGGHTHTRAHAHTPSVWTSLSAAVLSVPFTGDSHRAAAPSCMPNR